MPGERQHVDRERSHGEVEVDFNFWRRVYSARHSHRSRRIPGAGEGMTPQRANDPEGDGGRRGDPRRSSREVPARRSRIRRNMLPPRIVGSGEKGGDGSDPVADRSQRRREVGLPAPCAGEGAGATDGFDVAAR